jgi:hypothetical protein
VDPHPRRRRLRPPQHLRATRENKNLGTWLEALHR